MSLHARPRAASPAMWVVAAASSSRSSTKKGGGGGNKKRNRRGGPRRGKPKAPMAATVFMDERCTLKPPPQGSVLPKLIVYDLDDTIWWPEMYMICGVSLLSSPGSTKFRSGPHTDDVQSREAEPDFTAWQLIIISSGGSNCLFSFTHHISQLLFFRSPVSQRRAWASHRRSR